MSAKTKLNAEEIERVKKAAGEAPDKLARRWRIHPDTLARVLAGYPVNEGTKAQIELGLQKEAE